MFSSCPPPAHINPMGHARVRACVTCVVALALVLLARKKEEEALLLSSVFL